MPFLCCDVFFVVIFVRRGGCWDGVFEMVMCKTDSARLSMSRLDLAGSSCQGKTVDLEPLSRYKHPFLGDPPSPLLTLGSSVMCQDRAA